MHGLEPTHREQQRIKQGFRLFMEERLVDLRDNILSLGDLAYEIYRFGKIVFLFFKRHTNSTSKLIMLFLVVVFVIMVFY